MRGASWTHRDIDGVGVELTHVLLFGVCACEQTTSITHPSKPSCFPVVGMELVDFPSVGAPRAEKQDNGLRC